jgi:hypothetical protein
VNPVLALAVWMLCAGATVACSGTFRFDDHSIATDAGGTPDSAVDAAGERSAACTTSACEFLGEPCVSDECLLHCPHGKICTGRCQSKCTADCEENSLCTLTTEDNADLECEPGARCSFVVGRATRVECRSTSDCGTRCLGNCTIVCAADATCALACGETDPLAVVSGTTGCR